MKKIQTSRFPQGALAVQFAEADLEAFLAPLLRSWPDKRLRALRPSCRVCWRRKARMSTKAVGGRQWAVGSRRSADCCLLTVYPLLHSRRVTTRPITKRLYLAARQVVAEAQPQVLMVAIDPVPLEKPYTRRLEGVSQVDKSRPPDRWGKARLTWGYPAITATIINLQQPACTYVRWFSYPTPDFVRQNRHLRRAIRTTRALFPQHALAFVLDGVGDDQKVFRWVREVGADFIVTVAHRKRVVEGWHERLARWEPITIGAWMQRVLWRGTFALDARNNARCGWVGFGCVSRGRTSLSVWWWWSTCVRVRKKRGLWGC